MSRSASCASGRLGKRTRNASETASLSSWGSEVNVLSDVEEDNFEVPKKRRSVDGSSNLDMDLSGRAFTSSDEESQQQMNSSSAPRGKRPKCFSRNAVLARQNRLKKKKYIEDLENELLALRRENSKLKMSLDGYSKDVQLVRKENKYLRNVLANNKEISHLLRSINVNCGLPSLTPMNKCVSTKKLASRIDSNPKVHVESAVPPFNLDLEPIVPSTDSLHSDFCGARTVKRDFPIAVDDVPLSLSAPEDEENDDLDILFGSKEISTELDFNLNEPPCDDDLGFGPNAFGDWLDGEEPLANIGVCLHVAKKKVSLEFCSSCNENAFSSWNTITV
ncbi:CREB/ATF bZIP transcription factor [Frankliniella fusca]|uniref:CREB/ATF bZIP transcription factor n=1 Tax=Frankliniella fusca TaxID=407009 RepID=A0AAE1LE70_9NEOP|nr:CREB/ATF bZIP transcription factor [Frankliniella fusca]